MNNAAHLEAAIPAPCYVYGLKLRPFCIGHYLTLSRIDSSTLSDTPLITDGAQLKTAAIICSQDWETGREFIFSKELQDQALKWGKKTKQFILLEEFSKFIEYAKEGLKAQDVWSDGSTEGDPLGCHWTEFLIVSLTSLMNVSESEAYNMYIPAAQRRVIAYWEIKNRKRILVNENDKEDERKAREFAEKLRERLCRN
jgi:hypothetical protein